MLSSKPGKQRKRQVFASAHVKRKMLVSPVSDDLYQKHRVRKLSVRTGDSVRIVRGDFAGLVGKVETIDYSSGKLYVEGISHGSKIRPATAKTGVGAAVLEATPERTHMGA
ncbi:50S ribosomal protein L24 [Candidatus Bathyarchaeota archaeon]|nr:MAG: 50S ribosomal protein L24 [Candidatus Bathyarchaeota archaeon]